MKALLGCSWEILISIFCEIFSSSSRSLYDDLVRSSCQSWHEDPLEFLVGRSCRDPAQIFREFLAVRDSVQVLVRRSCGDPSNMLSEALAALA